MKKYNIIYADPPWAYQDKNCRGASARHYKTMTDSELQSLPIKDIAADDCILFMWAVYPKIKEALDVIDAWGFKYKTIGFQWVKQNKSGDEILWMLEEEVSEKEESNLFYQYNKLPIAERPSSLSEWDEWKKYEKRMNKAKKLFGEFWPHFWW